VEGTVISPSVVSATSEATPTISAETSKHGSIGLIIGLAVGVVLLIGAVTGALLFFRRRRRNAAAQPNIDAYHPDLAASSPRPTTQATAIKSKRGFVVASKDVPSVPPKSVALPSTERGASTTTLVSSKSPLPTTSLEITPPAVPPMPPIPRTPSPDAKPPLISTPDISSTSHPNRAPPTATASLVPRSVPSPADNLPTTTGQSQMTTSDSNTVTLRSEIEGLREQVRLLQIQEATRRHDSELRPYEPPPQYSPRRSGHQSDDEDD
jgi:hypothetical protein